jgi:hypothetical protein
MLRSFFLASASPSVVLLKIFDYQAASLEALNKYLNRVVAVLSPRTNYSTFQFMIIGRWGTRDR